MSVISLGATRSSHNWQAMPGNWDRLNTRALYPSSNDLGIPDLPYVDTVPSRLVAYNARHQIDTAKPGDCVHFFLDDYRFEVAWSMPLRGLKRPVRVGLSLTPDFSLWTEMPLVMQQWNVYRSRWCGMWMSQQGVTVIPTISWSTPESYEFAFLGIQEQSTVAISTVGVTKASYGLFIDGVNAMRSTIRPKAILVYGRELPRLDTASQYADVVYYPYRQQGDK